MSLSVRDCYLLPLLICSCYLPSQFPILTRPSARQNVETTDLLPDQIQLGHPCRNDSRWPQETEKNTIIQHMGMSVLLPCRQCGVHCFMCHDDYYMSRNNCGRRFVKRVAHSEIKLFYISFISDCATSFTRLY